MLYDEKRQKNIRKQNRQEDRRRNGYILYVLISECGCKAASIHPPLQRNREKKRKIEGKREKKRERRREQELQEMVAKRQGERYRDGSSKSSFSYGKDGWWTCSAQSQGREGK